MSVGMDVLTSYNADTLHILDTPYILGTDGYEFHTPIFAISFQFLPKTGKKAILT